MYLFEWSSSQLKNNWNTERIHNIVRISISIITSNYVSILYSYIFIPLSIFTIFEHLYSIHSLSISKKHNRDSSTQEFIFISQHENGIYNLGIFVKTHVSNKKITRVEGFRHSLQLVHLKERKLLIVN